MVTLWFLLTSSSMMVRMFSQWLCSPGKARMCPPLARGKNVPTSRKEGSRRRGACRGSFIMDHTVRKWKTQCLSPAEDHPESTLIKGHLELFSDWTAAQNIISSTAVNTDEEQSGGKQGILCSSNWNTRLIRFILLHELISDKDDPMIK
ncbi:hypothetical protein ILYODFUR_026592 [Ilyodon furcidens]|uniref:Secreted protein n=1 Tax=Ilyodon furcidens TaxID=33524 RepID=A0ABV0UCL5_9TELE